jgi:hypothetical protein
VCAFFAFFRDFFTKFVKILTEISGIFGKFFPEFFTFSKLDFTAVSLRFATFFGGKIPEFPGWKNVQNFPKSGKIRMNF